MKSVTGIEIPEQLAAYDRFRAEASASLTAYHQLLLLELEELKNPSSELASVSVELARLVAPTYGGSSEYYISRLFVALISAFEMFLSDTLTMIIQLHPKKAGAIALRFSDVLDAGTFEAVTIRAADELIRKLMYKKPTEYLNEYCDLLSIDRKPLKPHWSHFVEAKARRDLGVHAAWKCNHIYLRKLSEAGISPQHKLGDLVLPHESKYFLAVSQHLIKLSESITQQTMSKHYASKA